MEQIHSKEVLRNAIGPQLEIRNTDNRKILDTGTIHKEIITPARTTDKKQRKILSSIEEEDGEIPDIQITNDAVQEIQTRKFLKQQLPATLEYIIQAANQKDILKIAIEIEEQHPKDMMFPPKDWLSKKEDFEAYLGALFLIMNGDVDPTQIERQNRVANKKLKTAAGNGTIENYIDYLLAMTIKKKKEPNDLTTK